MPLVNANVAQRGGGKTPDAKYCPTPQLSLDNRERVEFNLRAELEWKCAFKEFLGLSIGKRDREVRG
jgi:hypothetical protein